MIHIHGYIAVIFSQVTRQTSSDVTTEMIGRWGHLGDSPKPWPNYSD